MLFSPPQKHIEVVNHTLKIGNNKIERVGNNMPEKDITFLGIKMDEHFRWQAHLNSVNLKMSKSLFAIKQVKHIFSKDCLLQLYYTLIQPFMYYGIQLWGSASQKVIAKTIILQKRAVRIINNAPYNSHTEPLFKEN